MTELTSFQQRLRDFLTSRDPEKITYQELARAMDPDVNPRDRRFKRLTNALYHVNRVRAREPPAADRRPGGAGLGRATG